MAVTTQKSRLSYALLALVLGCGSKSPSPLSVARQGDADSDEVTAKPTPKPEASRLVLLLVIDQLPSWTFDRDLELLDGGLARLAREGRYFSNAAIPYASSYTAPGHALIGTGATPSESGVMANAWFDQENEREHHVGQDPNTQIFDTQTGEASLMGVSSIDLRVDGLAEALRAGDASSKSVAIGLKDRAVIFMAGRRPDRAVWYDDAQLAFTTSTFYSKKLPSWVVKQNKESPISDKLDYVWERQFGEAKGYESDVLEGEGSPYGMGTQFPHNLSESESAAKALRLTPLGIDITWEIAARALSEEALGRDVHPDLLAVTISSHDYAGHGWGQESWERLEVLRHLDKTVATFLGVLDEQVGVGRYSVVVTSDHGATPLVEQSQRKGISAHRVSIIDISRRAQKATTKIAGRGKWIRGLWANTLYFSKDFKELPKNKQIQILKAVMKSVRKVPGVGFVGLTDELIAGCSESRADAAIACKSLRSGRSGELYVSMKDFSLPRGDYKAGTGHGGPAEHDRVVPVIIWGPKVQPKKITTQVSMERVAPTVAELLGVKLKEPTRKQSLLQEE